MESKLELRKKLRVMRSKIDKKLRDQASIDVANIFEKSVLYKEAQNIACYFASGYELDTQPLINAIWNSKKNCYLPVISEEKDAILSFSPHQKTDELKLNQFNILEPSHLQTTFPAEKLDLVFLPLLAYDKKGHRLGSGGGYYDRTFYPIKKDSQKPLLIGLGFQLQEIEEVPHDHWDIPLDGVLTNESLVLF